MDIGGYRFNRACEIDADRAKDGSLLLDSPHSRYANLKKLSLHAHGVGPFVRLRTENLPADPGVCVVVSQDSSVFYVGRARDSIRQRWSPQGYAVIHARNCYQGGQSTNCRINLLISKELAQHRSLELWVLIDLDPTPIESAIIRSLRPPWNLRL